MSEGDYSDAHKAANKKPIKKGYSDYSVDHLCVQVNPNSDNVVDSK